jgi:hypothetical protein
MKLVLHGTGEMIDKWGRLHIIPDQESMTKVKNVERQYPNRKSPVLRRAVIINVKKAIMFVGDMASDVSELLSLPLHIRCVVKPYSFYQDDGSQNLGWTLVAEDIRARVA